MRTGKVLDVRGAELLAAIREFNPGYDVESPLFRGIRGEKVPVVVKDPKTERRWTATRESDAYTDFMNASANWKGIPRRNWSIMMSNAPWTTKTYGELYAVVPESGAQVAHIKYDDLWNHRVFPRLGKYSTRDTINELFSNIVSKLDGETVLEWLRRNTTLQLPIERSMEDEVMERFSNAYECVDWLIDPDDVVFVPDVSELPHVPKEKNINVDSKELAMSVYLSDGVEMWTEAKCMVIEWETYRGALVAAE